MSGVNNSARLGYKPHSKMSGKVIVLQESSSGENTRFRDMQTGVKMTRGEFVRAVEKGNYPDYRIRIIEGVKRPVLNGG